MARLPVYLISGTRSRTLLLFAARCNSPQFLDRFRNTGLIFLMQLYSEICLICFAQKFCIYIFQIKNNSLLFKCINKIRCVCFCIYIFIIHFHIYMCIIKNIILLHTHKKIFLNILYNFFSSHQFLFRFSHYENCSLRIRSCIYSFESA